MALRAIILVDVSVGEDELATLKQAARQLSDGERGVARLMSGDEAALVTLASSISSQLALWTEQSIEAGAPSPAPMSAAPLVYTAEGRPDWGIMWTSFCALALHGGPPHRGPQDPVLASALIEAEHPGFDAVAEIQLGIFETTGLRPERVDGGWLSITCASRRMAAWMCAAIILENVDARSDGWALFVPAHPSFELTDQVKSVITVIAKVHHYWQVHLAAGSRTSTIAPTDEEVPAIARQYREVLACWGQARAARDISAAGQLHDQMHVLTAQLALTAVGRDAIEAFLTDADVWVRLWSATEALPWAPAQARRVLAGIKDARAAAAVDAEWALLQHDAGRA